uniref:Large ribosomal subunit protein uL22m n=1 Tax=Hirondellea gigas TaxID=1518452 RepID=A0A2P2I5I4_9CRUS
MLTSLTKQIGSHVSHLVQPALRNNLLQCVASTGCRLPLLSAPELHTSAFRHRQDKLKFVDDNEISTFQAHNEKKYPPQQPGEAPRPAFVCHEMRNFKYSPKNMWYVAVLIRGMAVEDAINQLKFCHRKGAVAVLQTIREAQQLAVEEHNVEFPSNLWVSESFCLEDSVIRGMRRHARARVGKVDYRYVRYCCTLEEGSPPKHYYYYTRPKEPQELLQEWLQKNRKRTIFNSL